MTSGSFGVAALTGIVSGGSETLLRGPTYDTLTHKTGPDADASVGRDFNGELNGQIDIAGYTLKFEGLEPTSSQKLFERYFRVYDDSQYRKDESPLKLTIDHWKDHVSGILSRPSGKYGKLGFILFPEGNPRIESARTSLVPDSRWVESDYTFETPETGVPTDSGIDRVKEIVSADSTEDN